MASNTGLLNELQIASNIDGKHLSEINQNLQTMIRMIFPESNGNDIFEARQIDDFYKPDIYLKHNNVTKYLSIKMGHSNEVHSEDIDSFITFLRRHGVSQETLNTILLCHYGDGTLDGSGSKRLNTMELTFKYSDKIKKANNELNTNYSLILEVIDRALVQGIDPKAKRVNYFYFGTPDYGNLTSIHQIKAFVCKKCWTYFNCLHIGPLFLKPRARYVDKEIVSEYRRHLLVLYWPNLAEDIDYIGHRYTFVCDKN